MTVSRSLASPTLIRQGLRRRLPGLRGEPARRLLRRRWRGRAGGWAGCGAGAGDWGAGRWRHGLGAGGRYCSPRRHRPGPRRTATRNSFDLTRSDSLREALGASLRTSATRAPARATASRVLGMVWSKVRKSWATPRTRGRPRRSGRRPRPSGTDRTRTRRRARRQSRDQQEAPLPAAARARPSPRRAACRTPETVAAARLGLGGQEPEQHQPPGTPRQRARRSRCRAAAGAPPLGRPRPRISRDSTQDEHAGRRARTDAISQKNGQIAGPPQPRKSRRRRCGTAGARRLPAAPGRAWRSAAWRMP